MNDYKELIADLTAAANRNSNSLNTRDTCRKAADAIEQLVKERDALFDGLKYTSLSGRACAFCKHKGKYEKCNDCEPYVSKNKWEWRGVEPSEN